MFLHLNLHSGVPVYRQVIAQVRERIASGQLPPATQLPSVRELSAQLQVNPLTVSKAYQFLERDGLVEFRRGQGTFVAAQPPRLSPEEQKRLIAPALEQAVSEAIHLGLTLSELQTLLRDTYDSRNQR